MTKSYYLTYDQRLTIGEYTQLTANDLDTASARAASGIPYEDEPVVRIARQLMEENTFIICRKNATPQMCEFVHLKRNSGNSEGQDKLDSVWSNPDKSGHPLQKKNRSQRPSWNRKNEGENAL